ncbi:MAG: hypothetical protein ABIY51_07190 [Ferruginibacter sp.]
MQSSQSCHWHSENLASGTTPRSCSLFINADGSVGAMVQKEDQFIKLNVTLYGAVHENLQINVDDIIHATQHLCVGNFTKPGTISANFYCRRNEGPILISQEPPAGSFKLGLFFYVLPLAE